MSENFVDYKTAEYIIKKLLNCMNKGKLQWGKLIEVLEEIKDEKEKVEKHKRLAEANDNS